jgi:hypothetical protein
MLLSVHLPHHLENSEDVDGDGDGKGREGNRGRAATRPFPPPSQARCERVWLGGLSVITLICINLARERG